MHKTGLANNLKMSNSHFTSENIRSVLNYGSSSPFGEGKKKSN